MHLYRYIASGGGTFVAFRALVIENEILPAHLCRKFTTTYHIEDASCIDLEEGTIRHKPQVGSDTPEETCEAWLPEGPFDLGMTAGASTPNNKIGEALMRILQIRGLAQEIEDEEAAVSSRVSSLDV